MNKNDIQPYLVEIPQSVIDDLFNRIDQTRFPDEDPAIIDEQSVSLTKMKTWLHYWRKDYPIHNIADKFNAYPLYQISVDDYPIVFTHVETDPQMPYLILLHGWPDTALSYFPMIELLKDNFNLIIPTLPGFGLPGPAIGLNVTKAAELLSQLMTQLEIENYYLHGVDFGSSVARHMATLSPEKVKGLHVTQLFHANANDETQINHDDPIEQASYEANLRYQYELSGYSTLQSTKPQDLAFSMSDSPSGLLAWMASQYLAWSSEPNGVTDEQIIDNVMVNWVYNTAASSARYYRLEATEWGSTPTYNSVPTYVTVMPDDIGIPIERLAQETDNIQSWTHADKGGHFASYENPNFIAREIIKMLAN